MYAPESAKKLSKSCKGHNFNEFVRKILLFFSMNSTKKRTLQS